MKSFSVASDVISGNDAKPYTVLFDIKKRDEVPWIENLPFSCKPIFDNLFFKQPLVRFIFHIFVILLWHIHFDILISFALSSRFKECFILAGAIQASLQKAYSYISPAVYI